MLIGAGQMTDLSLTILTERPEDAAAIERLHERTFGPGRYARTAYRIREQLRHRLDLSYTARIGTLLVGSVRLTAMRIGDTPALLLGPLTIEPPFRDRGIGKVMMERALKDAKDQGSQARGAGRRRAVLRARRLQARAEGRDHHDGPVDPARMLAVELVEGALSGVSGVIRPDWDTIKRKPA